VNGVPDLRASEPARSVRGRFAPSPTGRLHFGSLVAALGSWLRARSTRGAWIVRMEDVDTTREVPGAAEDILATLAAFGMQSDEVVVRQSSRTDRYSEVLDALRARDLAYACRCSRSQLAAFGGVHPPHCIAMQADDSQAPAWRVRAGDSRIFFEDINYGPVSQDIGREVGDFVVRRSDGCFAYQLAVVVDDADQGIDEVVRGVDLLDSTPRQILLQRLLALPTPRYLHLPLALDEHGRKLSKQDSARPVHGEDPLPALRAALAFLGQKIPRSSHLPTFLDEAVAGFVPACIPRAHHEHVALRKD
jgi:glutamyl-Q tRNA(Asp) synthetase